jgi:hypothetical protein
VSDVRTLGQILADCRKRFVISASPVESRGRPLPPEPRDPERQAGDSCAALARIPPSFRWATLEAPELRRRVERGKAIGEAMHAISAQGLLLVGPSGCGKTSLACALLRAWYERNPGRRGTFLPAWRLGVARAQHGAGAGEAPEVARALAAALLVLDDLGCERNTALNAVADVISERAYLGRPTWITTWMTAAQVSLRYGEGIARRLYEADRTVVAACGPADGRSSCPDDPPEKSTAPLRTFGARASR